MIAYPIVFAVVALPYSVIRWKTRFGATHSLPTATFAVCFLFGFSGAFNVLLFLLTRPNLLLPRNRNRTLVAALGVNSPESALNSSISNLETRQRQRGEQPLPVGALPRADDGGWRLPTPESSLNESV